MPNKTLFIGAVMAVMLLTPMAHSAVVDSEMAELLELGCYDTVITQTTTEINDGPSRPTMHYLRGRAYWEMGQFSNAAADFAQVGHAAPWSNAAPPSEYLRKFSAIQKASPTQSQCIMDGERVKFRVYYDTLTPRAQAIIAQLAQAGADGQRLFHTDMTDVSVYIFADKKRFAQFFRAWMNSEPQPWQNSGGNTGMLLFSDSQADAVPGFQWDDMDYLRSTVSHEYAHCVTRWIVGTVLLPSWFHEGLAMYAGSMTSPKDLTNNEQSVRGMVASNSLLSYTDLNRMFYQSYEAWRTGRSRSNAYEQGLSMVRHLLTRISTAQLAELLRHVRDERNFESAFARTVGMTPQAFYNVWRQEAMNQHLPKRILNTVHL